MILDKIKQFKKGIEEIKETHPKVEFIGKGGLCKLLVLASIAEMCIEENVKVPENDKNYFLNQAAVGRYYSDWGLEWIANDYFEICEYIKGNHW